MAALSSLIPARASSVPCAPRDGDRPDGHVALLVQAQAHYVTTVLECGQAEHLTKQRARRASRSRSHKSEGLAASFGRPAAEAEHRERARARRSPQTKRAEEDEHRAGREDQRLAHHRAQDRLCSYARGKCSKTRPDPGCIRALSRKNSDRPPRPWCGRYSSRPLRPPLRRARRFS